MPRIPVRVEPYSSPSRQHRHYKNKRDQVLRALGKAAYINGSHFAIMWVSARGDVETYASEALQSRLDDWFVKGGIAEEAKELVKGSPASAHSGPKLFEESEDEDDTENSGDLSSSFDDPFLDHRHGMSGSQGKKHSRPLAPLNTAIANQHFLRSRPSMIDGSDDLSVPKSAPLFPSSSAFPGDDAPRSSTPLLTSRSLIRNSVSGVSSATIPSAPSQNSTSFEITLANEAARTAFLELRFGQLQQGVCKTVAKAWIKIIEPKKQTRCPYNKGEEGKPDWWPSGVRHKEPDHLMKPERHALLLTILRSPKIQVARLQLATAEVVALIKADKVSLLMDVYRIAREEEKIREKGQPKETSLTVSVSTLDGWCSSDNAPTTQGLHIARSASPEPCATAEKRKRPATTAMSKAGSTGSILASKRRSIATPAEFKYHHGHNLRNSTSAAAATAAAVSVGLRPHMPLHHPAAGVSSLSRAFSISGPTMGAGGPSGQVSTMNGSTGGSACNSSGNSPWQTAYPTFTEVNGLVTPITGSASIDPAFHSMASDPSQPHMNGHSLSHHGNSTGPVGEHLFYAQQQQLPSHQHQGVSAHISPLVQHPHASHPAPPPSFFEGHGQPHAHQQHGHPAHHLESSGMMAAVNNPAFAPGNALGLELPASWNFNLDMSGLPDLSHGTSWNDSTFSFDSLNASTNPADQGGPKTPPPTSSNQDLRLNLQPDSNLHLNLHAEKMASSHQAANNNTNLWIPNASQSSTTSSHHH